MEKFCFIFTFINNVRVIKMKETKPCTSKVCMSGILSIADQIILSFPFLVPPYSYKGEWAKPKVTEKEPWEGGIFHPYYEIWTEIILSRTLSQCSLVVENTFYVNIQLSQDLLAQIKVPIGYEELVLSSKETSAREKLEQAFNLPKIQPSKIKMGVFYLHPIHNRVGFPFSMTLNMEAIFIGQLYNNEQWVMFNVVKGQIPSVEELSSCSGIILPGSTLSVLDMYPELIQSMNNLQKARIINKDLRVLGVCYGHQLVAKHFGAKVQKRNRKGGIQQIKICQQLRNKIDFLPQSFWETPLLISEHHEDFVANVPSQFQLLARSQSCEVESMISRDGRIWTAQFHSQFFVDFTKIIQERWIYNFKNDNYKNFYIKSAEEIEKKSIQHSKKMLECFKQFLRASTK